VKVSSPEGITRRMETIYVALRDEAVDVWRPVEATREGESIYRIKCHRSGGIPEHWPRRASCPKTTNAEAYPRLL